MDVLNFLIDVIIITGIYLGAFVGLQLLQLVQHLSKSSANIGKKAFLEIVRIFRPLQHRLATFKLYSDVTILSL